MKDKTKVLKTYRDCTGKNAIYLIKKTKPNEKNSFFSLGLRSVCTNFSNGKLGGTSAIQNEKKFFFVLYRVRFALTFLTAS